MKRKTDTLYIQCADKTYSIHVEADEADRIIRCIPKWDTMKLTLFSTNLSDRAELITYKTLPTMFIDKITRYRNTACGDSVDKVEFTDD